jgi:erythromycin esterase
MKERFFVKINVLTMKTKTLLLLFCYLIVSCKKDSVTPTANIELIKAAFQEEGFSTMIVPFSAVPSSSIADLQNTNTMLAGKQIVGMGEATHGTSEFQTIKHRYFQFLALELGFRNLAIEENFSAVVPLNEYIRSGTGDIKSLINGLRSSMFKTKEFYDLVVWMRDYNKNKSDSDKVNLYGMDAQNTGYSALAAQKLIQQYESSYLPKFNSLASSFLVDLTDFKTDQEAVAALPSLVAKAQEISNHIQNNAAAYHLAGAKSYALLKQHITVIQQALNQYTQFLKGTSAGFETRDKNMAANVQWIESTEGLGSKIMVWVHNGHINLQPSNYFSNDVAINVLGTNLRKVYGSKFYSIGFLFNQGSFSAVNNYGQDQVFTVKPLSSAYLAQAMSSLNVPVFFYDLAQSSLKPKIRQVFSKEHDMYLIGAGYTGKESDAIYSLNFSKEYDGLIFIDSTKAYQPL